MAREETCSSADTAGETFIRGFNCAQAVLTAFGPTLGADLALCFKIATPFGAGMARRQDTCGAVSGALMVLGLKYGRGEDDGEAAKDKAYELSNEFIRRFEKKHGSVMCRDLLGINFNTAEGYDEMKRRDLLNKRCLVFVKDAAGIIDELLKEKK